MEQETTGATAQVTPAALCSQSLAGRVLGTVEGCWAPAWVGRPGAFTYFTNNSSQFEFFIFSHFHILESRLYLTVIVIRKHWCRLINSIFIFLSECLYKDEFNHLRYLGFDKM